MSEVIALLRQAVDANGELHLDAKKTFALLRYLSGVALMNAQLEESLSRVVEFGGRFLKTIDLGGMNEKVGVFTEPDIG